MHVFIEKRFMCPYSCTCVNAVTLKIIQSRDKSMFCLIVKKTNFIVCTRFVVALLLLQSCYNSGLK